MVQEVKYSLPPQQAMITGTTLKITEAFCLLCINVSVEGPEPLYSLGCTLYLMSYAYFCAVLPIT